MRDERLGKYRNLKVSRKESWRILPVREKRHHQYPELDRAVPWSPMCAGQMPQEVSQIRVGTNQVLSPVGC